MNLINKYYIDDILSYKNNKNRETGLHLILWYLEYRPNAITAHHIHIVERLGLIALSSYMKKAIAYDEFVRLAKAEQMQRVPSLSKHMVVKKEVLTEEKQLQNAKQEYVNLQKQHERTLLALHEKYQKEIENLKAKHTKELNLIQEKINKAEHQFKLKNDEKYAQAYHAEQAKIKLLWLFGVENALNQHTEILLAILQKLNENKRLTEEQTIWLETIGREHHYFRKDGKIYQQYHRLEAEYYVDLYQKDKRIWHLINASSHFRKANLAQKAHDLLFSNVLNKIPHWDRKLRSAFWTTFGGVKRDLGLFHDGINMAYEAHELAPKDYRPCTLLGALYFEIRQYNEGTEWFEKAEERGASKHNSDAEIKAIYHKANKEDKAKLKDYLLKLDPSRYAWLNSGQSKKKNK